ncbi:telomere repeats-binding bouquet formation protein 1 [Gracilinanus agilis]|uniref:telomere repeats-binding bouquet formation protein 1 n=1 Tax=Gracilinanus agilis TaxID=191870 RepID=UPI001CFD60B7|nr:telomere repeats-binding bouquet formation protein 1 [Gracilinanus agilis]
MENDEMKKTQEMKTDLNLLLECLKYQMDNPSSQKEALVTIYSVCQQNSDASIYFREIGGLMFVKNLAKSSIHSMVKEAALFTLGAIAECNVYCQQTLCTSEFFEDIIWFLSKYESNINLKRMSIYVMLVLVSNNRTGQTLVRETGCVGILLQFFRTVLSLSEMDLSNETINQSYQLWSSVCSALCACVNNPQNDVNQKICSSVFQHANKWLQSCIKPEIIRPICSFICLTVANNTHVQEYFISIGGLAVLSEVLIKLEQDSHGNLPSAKLAVVVTKTLDACIADNPAVGVVLSKYHIVSKLLTLLLHESLDSGEKFSIILTLGHCTESCEENQLHLFQNNGLPLMIQVLTESQNEELNKAATFVLHNCKKITEKLSLNLEESSEMNEAQHLKELKVRERNIEGFWKKAKEILHRIEQLENKEDEEKREGRKLVDDSFPRSLNIQKTPKCPRVDGTDRVANAERNHPQKECQPQSYTLNTAAKGEAPAGPEPQNLSGSDKTNPASAHCKASEPARALSTAAVPSAASTTRSPSVYQGVTGDKRYQRSLRALHLYSVSITLRQIWLLFWSCNSSLAFFNQEVARSPCCRWLGKDKNGEIVLSSGAKEIEQACKNLAPAVRSRKHQLPVTDPLMLCSDIISKEVSNFQGSDNYPKTLNFRCSGCIEVGKSLNSRNFSRLLHSCPFQCDRHKVILEAEDRYKSDLRKSLICNKKIVLTPYKKKRLRNEYSTHEERKK